MRTRPARLLLFVALSGLSGCVLFNAQNGDLSGGGAGGNGSGGGGGGGGGGSHPVSMTGIALVLPMDEGSWNGTANEVTDGSGSAHHGTAVNGATTSAGGQFGRAGDFDGTSHVLVTDGAGLQPADGLTVAFWVYPRTLDGNPKGVVSKRTDYNDGSASYSVWFGPADSLWIDIDTEDNRFGTNYTFLQNTWVHVAVVYDGTLAAASRVKVYVDGSLDTTATENSATIASHPSTNIHVGVLPEAVNTQFLDGLIDDVGIWHRALSATEVSDLYLSGDPI